MHPGRSCNVVLETAKTKQAIGHIGEIHPALMGELGLRQNAFLFELNLDALRPYRQETRFTDLPSTPTVLRDLTVDLKLFTNQQLVQKTIRTAAGPYLTGIELISIFPLSEGKESLTYRLSFQHPSETLTNEAIEPVLQGIRESLQSNLGGSFRSS
jgi:phenylalanyl-tRNA synthetase beta chain